MGLFKSQTMSTCSEGGSQGRDVFELTQDISDASNSSLDSWQMAVCQLSGGLFLRRFSGNGITPLKVLLQFRQERPQLDHDPGKQARSDMNETRFCKDNQGRVRVDPIRASAKFVCCSSPFPTKRPAKAMATGRHLARLTMAAASQLCWKLPRASVLVNP